MSATNFSTTFLIDKSAKEIFSGILKVRGWWSGIYSEEIEGSSNKLDDEFTFRAAGGKHYSKQKLIELIPGKKIVWLVTESNLTFLEQKDEWTGTKLCFDISEEGDKTEVRFTHIGLVPTFECYNGCSSTWPKYLEHLLSPLKAKAKEEIV